VGTHGLTLKHFWLGGELMEGIVRLSVQGLHSAVASYVLGDLNASLFIELLDLLR
jgi:hypothetical protein